MATNEVVWIDDDKGQQRGVCEVLTEADERLLDLAFGHGTLDAFGDQTGNEATDDKYRERC